MPKRSPARKAKKSREIVRSANLGVLRDILGFRLRRVHAHLVAGIAGSGIKPGELSALAIIAANPGISQIALAREGNFDKAWIVFLLDDLEQRGWAKRKRSTIDRRRHSLFLTPNGARALAKRYAVVRKNEEHVHHVLSSRELKNLFGLLDKIYDKCFARSSLRG